jgi:hypothetical protein
MVLRCFEFNSPLELDVAVHRLHTTVDRNVDSAIDLKLCLGLRRRRPGLISASGGRDHLALRPRSSRPRHQERPPRHGFCDLHPIARQSALRPCRRR